MYDRLWFTPHESVDVCIKAQTSERLSCMRLPFTALGAGAISRFTAIDSLGRCTEQKTKPLCACFAAADSSNLRCMV